MWRSKKRPTGAYAPCMECELLRCYLCPQVILRWSDEATEWVWMDAGDMVVPICLTCQREHETEALIEELGAQGYAEAWAHIHREWAQLLGGG